MTVSNCFDSLQLSEWAMVSFVLTLVSGVSSTFINLSAIIVPNMVVLRYFIDKSVTMSRTLSVALNLGRSNNITHDFEPCST